MWQSLEQTGVTQRRRDILRTLYPGIPRRVGAGGQQKIGVPISQVTLNSETAAEHHCGLAEIDEISASRALKFAGRTLV